MSKLIYTTDISNTSWNVKKVHHNIVTPPIEATEGLCTEQPAINNGRSWFSMSSKRVTRSMFHERIDVDSSWPRSSLFWHRKRKRLSTWSRHWPEKPELLTSFSSIRKKMMSFIINHLTIITFSASRIINHSNWVDSTKAATCPDIVTGTQYCFILGGIVSSSTHVNTWTSLFTKKKK